MTLELGCHGSQAWYLCPGFHSALGPQGRAWGLASASPACTSSPACPTACLQRESSPPQHLSKEAARAHILIHIIPKFVIGREEGWEEGRVKGNAGEIYFFFLNIFIGV